MADFSKGPIALADLYEWLLTNGFNVREDTPRDPFNQFTVVEDRPVQVAFRATRGEWDLTASFDRGRHYWQVDELEAFLAGVPWIGEPPTESNRSEFLRSRLPDLRERLEDNPSACKELSRLGDEWMSWKFGLPIPRGGFPGQEPC